MAEKPYLVKLPQGLLRQYPTCLNDPAHPKPRPGNRYCDNCHTAWGHIYEEFGRVAG